MNIAADMFTRRRFLNCIAALGLLAGFKGNSSAYARQRAAAATAGRTRRGAQGIDLVIRRQRLPIAGGEGRAITINGTVPGPLLRFREGETVAVRVANELAEDTSIHWHGLLVPPEMDGVPGVSFAGIRPGETFTYRYRVKQSGTYWYHSHSAFQEQSGLYGPLIIDPAEPEPFEYDRDCVVMLSDWTFEDPHRVLAKLKKRSGYYNFQKRTVADFFGEASKRGWRAALSERLAWGRMRMSQTDIADVTGYTYTYFMNGLSAQANWTALFRPGERVRLRFINGAAMTYFNIRIPGLEMTVVQADGQNVQPVTVDEFQIAVSETYDVIVHPIEDRAYTIFAEAMDRSGYTRGTLAPRHGMSAPIPELRPPPRRTMIDMGMEMGGMESMTGTEMGAGYQAGGPHGGHTPGMSMGGEAIAGREPAGSMQGMEKAGPVTARHGPEAHGPGNTAVALVQRNRLGEPGAGLEDVSHRVLVYADLRSLVPGYDLRPPSREIELHLTGNMERYMWSIDGKKYSEAKAPIAFRYGERLRVTLVNDTMMEHPMHLHGMWMELDNGAGAHKPRKFTISVKPAERLSFEVTADAPGKWAFHCHLLYHMELGMLRVVSVTQPAAEAKL